MKTYQYREPVLRMLEVHGLRPRPATPPTLVRDYLNDLYRYELRRLRGRLGRNEFPRSAYASLVESARGRYGLLSLPSSLWVAGGEDGPATPPRY